MKNKNCSDKKKHGRPRFGMRAILNLSSEVVSKVPNKDDGILGSLVKSIAMANTVRNFFFQPDSPLQEFINRHELKEIYSSSIVNLIYNSALASVFETRDVDLGGGNGFSLEEKTWNLGGSLYFVVNDNGPKPTFYYTPGFDFSRLFDMLWEIHEGRIIIRKTMTSIEFSGFPQVKCNLFGSSRAKLEKLCYKQRQYAKDVVPRTYLFLGQPGTGKTSTALKMADNIAKRILRIESESLINMYFEETSVILKNLIPDVLIVDDIDKVSYEYGGLSGLLSTLEWLKVEHPQVVVIFTANETKNMNSGLLRPGRIDEKHLFELPNKQDRTEIIKGYFDSMEIAPARGWGAAKIAGLTDGLSPAWLREVVLQTKYTDPRDAVDIAKLMVNIRGSDDCDCDDDGPEKAKPKPKPKKVAKKTAKKVVKKTAKKTVKKTTPYKDIKRKKTS